MKPFSAFVSGAICCAALLAADAAVAQTASPAIPVEKLNAYVACINDLSGRAYQARERYFSWVGKDGPTGKERIIYGTYTITRTSTCRTGVDEANAVAPHDAALESAATAYVEAVTKLEPLLKDTDDYYTQENYKDDKMAKGKALHPRLVAAWDAFAAADQTLRGAVDVINDKRATEKLAEIERAEGRKARYHVEALMIQSKRLMRAQTAEKPDPAVIETALNAYEGTVKVTEQVAGAGDQKIGSSFIGSAKSYLVTAKQMMRRVRDKVPYTTGQKMMLESGGGWMVEGSPPRLLRDYNDLVSSYNRGPGI